MLDWFEYLESLVLQVYVGREEEFGGMVQAVSLLLRKTTTNASQRPKLTRAEFPNSDQCQLLRYRFKKKTRWSMSLFLSIFARGSSLLTLLCGVGCTRMYAKHNKNKSQLSCPH